METMIQTQCPECQRINPVQAQDPRTIRPELQCAACLACNRVYNVQAHLAPEPFSETTAEDTAAWRTAIRAPYDAPDPQAPAAREAAPDAPCHPHEMQTNLIRGRICIMCQHGHCLEAMTPQEWAGSRIEMQIGVHQRDGCPLTHAAREAAQRADEAELQAGLLATRPPMAGGSGDDTVSCRADLDWRHWYTPEQREQALASIAEAAAHYRHRAAHTPKGQPVQMTPECCINAHAHCERSWQGIPCACLCHLPPMGGGAPTPADDPAGPGAPVEADNELSPRVAEALLDFMVADLTLRGIIRAPHTHPCPICHQARPCTGTGCADGPRECATCSQCRGW